MQEEDTDLDALFMRALVACLRRVRQEVTIARGRLRRGYREARSHLTDARDHVLRTQTDLEELSLAVWGSAFAGGGPLVGASPIDDALDVLALRQWCWALRICGEDVEIARTLLSRSKRHRVTAAMLATAHEGIVQASTGLAQLSRRAWG